MNFVFYDTETTGTDTAFDQILQFAAIRTDSDFNELERFEIRCQLLPHIVPAPGAMRVTGVTVKQLTDPAFPTHYQMTCAIRDKLQSWSPAIFAGYNSLTFDETLLRQAFYQTLHPLYLTNTAGNARMDVLRMMQAMSLFAPDTVTIPTNDKGDRVFKLDRVAPANGFTHEHAHDAMADVEATIYLCRLVKERAPTVWENAIRFSSKAAVARYAFDTPVFSLSEFYYNVPYSWTVTAVGVNPENDSDILVFDLAHDQDELCTLSMEQLVNRLKKQPKPLRSVRSNACPVIMPIESAPAMAKGMLLGIDELKRRAEKLKSNTAFRERLIAAYGIIKEKDAQEVSPHIEKQMYNGFYTAKDQKRLELFHKTPWKERMALLMQLDDTRLRVLAHRLIFLERPDLLDEAARREHEITVARRLLHDDGDNTPWLTLNKAIADAEALLNDAEDDKRQLLNEHRAYLLERLAWATNIASAAPTSDNKTAA